MATTTNYGWTTPDDTALVKDGASAIRSLGTSVDTTTKNLNPSTTLGDIEYRSSTANTNTRLGIGSTGQVLTVAGGVPSWATPAGGASESYSLLNTGGTALTGAATITVSGISGINKLLVLVEGASSANSASYFGLRINGDSGSNYLYFGGVAIASATYSSSVFQPTGATTDSSMSISRMANNVNSYIYGSVSIDGGNSTGYKSLISISGCDGNGGANGWNSTVQGIYKGSAVISSISLVSSTGNFDAGTVYVYGSAV